MSEEPRLVDQRVRYGLIRDALPPPPAHICEVGVGEGRLLNYLHEQGYNVHGCDVDLRPLIPDLPIADRVCQANGASLPFKDGQFDAVYSCDVLEHVQPGDREAFLLELLRVTKPGGVVVLTAFFRNTLAFRLWGVGYLFWQGTLPSWYTEHLTIPLPSEEATFKLLNEHLDGVHRIPYQRALNLFIMWLQSVSIPQRHLARIPDKLRFLIPNCDVIGRTTSVFFRGVKP